MKESSLINKEKPIQRITNPFVMCADVHLRDQNDQRTRLFLDGLERIDPSTVECLLLNGDIFDFCFGASPYFSKKFQTIGHRLSQLADAGVSVIFMQGNHEFALARLGWRGVTFTDQSSGSFLLKNGISISFCHGDLLAAPWHYHLYQRVVRSRIFIATAKIAPPAHLDRLALYLSKKSRQNNEGRRVPHRKILKAAQAWLNQIEGAKIGVLGHFHVPYNYCDQKSGGNRLIGVDSWDKPNFLVSDGQVFDRLFMTSVGADFEVVNLASGRNDIPQD